MSRTNPRDVIEVCRGAIASHGAHDLQLGLRHRVWTAMGPRCQNVDEICAGLNRRIELARECALKVLPLWHQAVPGDRVPDAILRTVDRLRGSGRPIIAREPWETRNAYWRYLMDKSYELKHLQIVCSAAFAVVQTLTVVLQDETFDPSSINDELTDQDIEADDLDAAFFAAAAFANGPTWVLGSNPLRRRDFWYWWLDTAGDLIPKT